jgi:hypothetical protein
MGSGEAVFELPWCPTCKRMRFGTACGECGLSLVIGQFVPLERAEAAEGVIALARPCVRNALVLSVRDSQAAGQAQDALTHLESIHVA